MNKWAVLVGIGAVSGFLSGLMGIGGALVLVPALVVLMKLSQHQAQAISLGLLVLPVSVFMSGYVYYQNGYIRLDYVFWVALGFVAGNYWGARWALRISSDRLKKIFYSILLLVALYFLIV